MTASTSPSTAAARLLTVCTNRSSIKHPNSRATPSGASFWSFLTRLFAVFAEVPARFGGGHRVLKLLSEDPSNYADAPREGIRRVLEACTGVLLRMASFEALEHSQFLSGSRRFPPARCPSRHVKHYINPNGDDRSDERAAGEERRTDRAPHHQRLP